MCRSRFRFCWTEPSSWHQETITSTTVPLPSGRMKTHREFTHTHTHTAETGSQMSCCVSRCISCVTSQWKCQWDAKGHVCSDQNDSVTGDHVVKPQQVLPQKLDPNRHFVSAESWLKLLSHVGDITWPNVPLPPGEAGEMSSVRVSGATADPCRRQDPHQLPGEEPGYLPGDEDLVNHHHHHHRLPLIGR